MNAKVNVVQLRIRLLLQKLKVGVDRGLVVEVVHVELVYSVTFTKFVHSILLALVFFNFTNKLKKYSL